MRTFKIAFTVGIDALSTVVSLLAAEVSHFEVNETKETEAPVRHNQAKHFPARPFEDQNCGKIILSAMADGKAKNIAELCAILQENGFSPSSASPATTHLVRRGKIARIAPKTFQIVNAVNGFARAKTTRIDDNIRNAAFVTEDAT